MNSNHQVQPDVSFVIPCYNLAHLLPECVGSILEQSHGNVEVLILDDCSPDATPIVAASFKDPRVQHIRNETNLGHLRNYNKGIGLARGRYIWLISADDRLRSPLAVERYVRYMDEHPQAGYIFCHAMGLRDGKEFGIVTDPSLGEGEQLWRGHDFLARLINANCIPSPCGMVRRESYLRGLFPLDLPYAGDWYLWCLFALFGDVAFIGEPLVCYRYHDTNITTQFTSQSQRILVSDDITVRWRILQKARIEGFGAVVETCRESIIRDYVDRIVKKDEEASPQGLTFHEFEQSLKDNAREREERELIWSAVCRKVADHWDTRERYGEAGRYYRRLIEREPASAGLWLKYLLLRMGRFGLGIRNMVQGLRKRSYAG